MASASPDIEVFTTSPRVTVAGLPIATAPTVRELYAVLGEPSRVEAGQPPAPLGHRNNQVHVYDALGLHLNEHHYTRRVTQISCWFSVDEPPFRFTPRAAFTGRLVIDGTVMPPGGKVSDFVRVSALPFGNWLGRFWAYRFGGFSLHVTARGHKLRSGGRSKSRQVLDVSVGWPHDNWGEPAM